MFLGVGGDGARPTFFELVAAERLMPSLKTAISYSMAVMEQRRPGLHRFLDYEDEWFALLTLVLERHSLRSGDGSFSEGLYGMKRTNQVTPGAKGLLSKQRLLSLAFLVGVPYLKAKLEKLHVGLPSTALRRGRALPMLPSLRANGNGDGEGRGDTSHQVGPLSGGGGGRLRTVLGRLAGILSRAFFWGYPVLHAMHESSRFTYQLMYMSGRTEYFSPGLHLLGLTISRISGEEVVEVGRREEGRRAREVARVGGIRSWPLRVASTVWLRAGFAAADHVRSALILTVFGFKMLEWWYSSAESRLAPRGNLPLPPPPPALKPAPGGCQLPDNRSLCPLCRLPRTNPGVAAASGYVFCYPCLTRYVEQWGRCPVTLVPMTPDGIRRLYTEA